MNNTVIIDDVEYEINVKDAVRDGYLSIKHIPITGINVGDVFKNSLGITVLILKSNDDQWYYAGLFGLSPFSDFRGNIKTTEQMVINKLNIHKYKYIKNINDDVVRMLKV